MSQRRAEFVTVGGSLAGPGVLSRAVQRAWNEMVQPAWRTGFSRRSDVEFRELLERLPVAAYTTDVDGLITWFNQDAISLWGRAPALNDPIDRWCGSFKLYATDGTPITHDACWMALAIRDERSYNAREIVIEREDGSLRTALAHANPIYADGTLAGGVNLLVDITERKAAERAASEADEAKTRFLAVLAHELRNPLAPMRGAIDLLARTDDPQARTGALGTLDRQLRHLGRIVDDLLDVGRITLSALELRLEPTELAPIIRHAAETIAPMIQRNCQRLEVELADERMCVRADGVRLAQLIGNLLSNAAKYSQPGTRIELRAERVGSDGVISVRDEGIGISPDLQPTIFDLFSRGDASEQDGLGVGLTLARQLAEMHGGFIEVRSAGPGQGSEFRVHLPLLAAERVPPPPAVVPAPRISGRRILVVDDNRDAAEVLGELLTLEGNEVKIAGDGVEAVEVAATWRPEVVLLDIGLPRIDGCEVARRLRSLDGGDALHIIALTGWGQARDRARTSEAGFDQHLVKPIDLETLAQALDALPAR